MLTVAKSVYRLGALEYDLRGRTHIMGILNVTPDSFSDGGRFMTVESAVKRGMEMIDEGADIIDVGGESTRPGAETISIEEEIGRVIPVVERLSRSTRVPISIDTYKFPVAEHALNAGAVIVNDISGLHADPSIAGLTARHGASLILMHLKGTPKTMQEDPRYEDVVAEVVSYLAESVRLAEESGVEQIIVDPGIGFGKTVAHNLELIKRLRELQTLGYPLLIGPSRKSFIGKILNLPVEERLEGTAAAIAVSIMNGANIVRVHDVREMKRVALLVDAICH